ncbi:MAG: DNA mismatch repair protein MutS, partial [Planctomycetota bacterium]
MATSPMMQQYEDAKALCGDALLFFRMGDFYELFHDDAKIAAEAVGLTLTSRDKSKNPIPMAGFPHHQMDGYLAKLIQLGHRVAICEQVEDPKQAKGLVKREVTRVVTPGTLTDDGLLDPREFNFLAATVFGKPLNRTGIQTVGVAWVELSTGVFFATSVGADRLGDELARIGPAEVLVLDDDPAIPNTLDESVVVTKRPAWVFARDESKKALLRHFETRNLEGFGFEADDGDALRAAGAIVDYLNETQKASLSHIDRLIPYRPGDRLEIDQATRRSLELTKTLRDGRRDGSLLAVLDRTVTAMGSRMMAEWLSSPLTSIDAIRERQSAVTEFLENRQLASLVRDELREVYDMQRLLTRVTTGRASPRDLQYIGRTLQKLPKLKE